MGNSGHIGKHRAVIAILEKEDISQAPDFKRLVEVQGEMNDDEKARTRRYLKDQMKEV